VSLPSLHTPTESLVAARDGGEPGRPLDASLRPPFAYSVPRWRLPAIGRATGSGLHLSIGADTECRKGQPRCGLARSLHMSKRSATLSAYRWTMTRSKAVTAAVRAMSAPAAPSAAAGVITNSRRHHGVMSWGTVLGS